MRRLLFGLMFLCLAFAANAQNDIRQVDFKNFTFEPLCIGDEPEKITVTDGEFSEEKEVEGYTERLYFSAKVEGYGDIDGDRQDEALIASYCSTGGTGNFSEGFIYTMRQGKPFLLARIEGGDRAYGGIRKISVVGGVVSVERNAPGEMGGACCPQEAETTKYKWNGSQLVAFGAPEKRELYPAKRITFAKGKSSAAIKATIPAGEFQRFVVGANRGQVLTVRVSPDDAASVNLRFGDAETTEDTGFMRAELNEKGDFTFEVSNNSETEGEFTVIVEIK